MTDISYKWHSMTDEGLSGLIGSFVKHHRLNQNKTQLQTANEAGISRSTLSLLERGESVSLGTLIQVLRVLDLLYIMDAFEVKSTISPIALAKLEQKQRQRASAAKDNDQNQSDW